MAPRKDDNPRNSKIVEALRRIAKKLDSDDTDAAEEAARDLFRDRKKGGSK